MLQRAVLILSLMFAGADFAIAQSRKEKAPAAKVQRRPAQKMNTKSSSKKPPARKKRTARPRKAPTPPPAPPKPAASTYNQLGGGLLMWQEDIVAKVNGVENDMLMQFIGVSFGIKYNSPWTSSRWRTVYGGDVAFGKTKGSTATDSLKDQMWFAFFGSAAIMYRTTAKTDLGLYVPVAARYINWDLRSGSGLEMDREFSFSAGAGGIYTQRFDDKNSLHVTVSRQEMWDATIWAATWERVWN